MDLSLIFGCAIVADVVILKLIPYRPGDEILLEGGVEGEVIQVNWRSTHLRNGANDVVVIPNSASLKCGFKTTAPGASATAEP